MHTTNGSGHQAPAGGKAAERDQCVAETVCQAPGCDRPIGHLRRQAKVCSSACRSALLQTAARSAKLSLGYWRAVDESASTGSASHEW